MATTNQTDNQAQVFEALKAVLQPFASELTVKDNTETNYYLETKSRSYKGKPMFFGAVMRKSYVSYHLMPLYWNPELLDNISPELKKRMQGKSCFNFKRVEPDLFAELKKLTEAGLAEYKKAKFL
ncbi:MAG: hypothetical protein JO150_08150 [Acidobacteriaceae bacterium]|nr:hypothetical protein [Acidobacteriaceae bacterium]MBV9938459.1 hypothetical protein [Acidobacteriaceae bacterium]